MEGGIRRSSLREVIAKRVFYRRDEQSRGDCVFTPRRTLAKTQFFRSRKGRFCDLTQGRLVGVRVYSTLHPPSWISGFLSPRNFEVDKCLCELCGVNWAAKGGTVASATVDNSSKDHTRPDI